MQNPRLPNKQYVDASSRGAHRAEAALAAARWRATRRPRRRERAGGGRDRSFARFGRTETMLAETMLADLRALRMSCTGMLVHVHRLHR